ncbi:zinc-finger binding domain of transposase IS66 [Sphingobium sp. YR768]|nr:zinc-finger binding domain of transposase IS66 [Sphingobium sp. YR768]
MLTQADLPDDIDALRALVLEQSRMLVEERIASEARLTELGVAKGEADAEIERLQSIIDAFMRHRFGRRSEHLDADQLQLGLEDVEIALGHARAAREALAPRARSDLPRKTNRGSLPAHLERIEQIVDIEDKFCPCCSGPLHQIGEDVAERLEHNPITLAHIR